MQRRAIDTQMRVLKAISELIEREGRSPTFRQIGRELGISVQFTLTCCHALRTKLMVSWEDGKRRTMRITAKGERILAEMDGEK